MPHTWPETMIDPHIHQWDPLTTQRTPSKQAHLVQWLPSVPRAFRWLSPRRDREFVGSPNAVLKPYLPNDYHRDCANVPVKSIVHIEAEWPHPTHMAAVGETEWLATLDFGQHGNPELGAIVCFVDPRWDDVGRVLDAHMQTSGLVRGVRFSLANSPDPGIRQFCDSPSAMRDPAFQHGLDEITGRGLSFELWCYSHQLPDAQRLIAHNPDTRFVLDHYATPLGIFGPRGKFTGHTASERAGILAKWKDDIAEIAALPNVVAKHSGLGMPLLGRDERDPLDVGDLGEFTERAAPLITHLQKCFGQSRTMWASNYPIDKPGLTLPATARILVDVLGSDLDPQQMFHDNAVATYGIAEAVS